MKPLSVEDNKLTRQIFCHQEDLIVATRSTYLGQRSLAVMLPDADSSGIRIGSPGFLRILEAFSLTHCSMESTSGLSGGCGFAGPSSVGPSDSLPS